MIDFTWTGLNRRGFLATVRLTVNDHRPTGQNKEKQRV